MREESLRIELGCDVVAVSVGDRAAGQFPIEGGDCQAALRQAVSAVEPGRRRVEVVVNALHVRLLVLPWADALTSEARWLAYAQSRFDDLFGDVADGWHLRVIAERPSRPRLAVALPMALLSQLEDAFGAGLRSVRVDALTRLDGLRGQEPRFTGAVADIGPRHALLSLLADGCLERVRLRRMTPSIEELRAALLVEWAGLGRGGPMPALAIGPSAVFDASDGEPLRALAPRLVRLQ